MKEIPFKIVLKPGAEKVALAMVMAYHKSFKGHRFVFSTGIQVTRSTFNAATPGKVLKAFLKHAEDAAHSLYREGLPVNNSSLKQRLEIIINRYQWQGNDLVFWNGQAVEYYTIPEGINRTELAEMISQEIQKPRPAVGKLIEGVLSEGGNTFLGFFQQVIDGKIKPRNGKPLKKKSKVQKQYALDVLRRYQNYAGVTLSFETMNRSFYQNFTIWAETIGKEWTDKEGNFRRGPYDVSNIGKILKIIKAILTLANINEISNVTKFSTWATPKGENEVITLTKDEVLRINKLNLRKNKREIRDAFILACFLGVRISDFKSLKPENLKTEKTGIIFFEYVQEKTGMICKIPVHPIALEIIERRGGKFPKQCGGTTIRVNIKAICKEAGLNDRVITKVRDNKPVYKVKWQAISPHSSRRTFATALYYGWFTKPMPSSFIMLFTGHKSESSFLKYINAKATDINERALEYFDIKPQMKVS